MNLIKYNKSILPALDIEDLDVIQTVVKGTCNLEKIGGYKIGITTILLHGLPTISKIIRNFTTLPIIIDGQKWGTDIPNQPKQIVPILKRYIDAVIIFPLAGPETQKVWMQTCKDEGLHTIVGGEMTHKGFSNFITTEMSEQIYHRAIEAGITDFVVPGNKPDRIAYYKNMFEEDEVPNFTLYSPGLVAQGGEITESGKIAGENWHAIVGRGIYEADDIGKAVEEYSSQLDK